MAIRALLVHLDDTPASGIRLNAALALAAAHRAEVLALYLVAEPFVRALVGKHMPAEFVREHLAELEGAAAAALAAAKAEAERRGVALTARQASGSLDRLPTLLARHARHADLTLIGQATLEAGSTDQALLAEAAFMDTGRPALVIPAAGGGALPPKRAIVAWDGSREAARAASDALPLLADADDVAVLVIDAERGGGRFSDQPGSGLVAYLARHGVKARLKATSSGGRGIAEVILGQAQEERADLLVMGGYGHSRFREMMLGGVTRHMLEHANLPLLLAH